MHAPKFRKNHSQDGKPRWTHILVRCCYVEIYQVAIFDGGRAHDLTSPGSAEDILDGRVNPQQLRNITLHNFSLVGSNEVPSNLRFVNENVEREGER